MNSVSPVDRYQPFSVSWADRFPDNLVAMDDQIREAIRQKLADATSAPLPRFTPREITTAAIAGKAQAVIGMRRAGKTTFLGQCLQERVLPASVSDFAPT
jgi:predicted AAA+ superfamily ATPase